MKNKLKYLVTALIVAVILSASAVCADAEEMTEPSGEEYASVAEGEGGGEENFFSKVYEEISAYSTDILSALTLRGSLTLAVAYKKGLLPLLERSLVTIGNAITKIKDTASESAEQSTALSIGIENKLTRAMTTLEMLSDKVASLNTALEDSIRGEKESKREKEELRIIVEAQIDMLYDIFMSSALPQYQKDAVGERIAKMREAMTPNEAE